jgi:hypothetical protein
VNNDWTGIVADENVDVEGYTISMIDTERKVGVDVMQQLVKMRLDNGKPTVHSFTGSNGDFNIIRLNTIAAGNLAAVSEQVKDATRSLIEQRNGQSLFSSYLKGLNEDLAQNINEDLL